jgi:glycerophosphoryl diester phosphodiesterase
MKRLKRMVWLGLFALVLGLGAWLMQGAIMQRMALERQELKASAFTVIAHRGASKDAPENTLAAFRKALSIGADWIELDVHLSKDGQVAVVHDPLLGRTVAGAGSIRKKSWQDLATLDAGSWFDPSFAGEKIPSLAQVLQLVQGQAKLLIEIKVDENNELYEGLVEAVLQDIAQHQAQDWCILQSFDTGYLTQIAALNKQIAYHKLMVADLAPLPAYIDTGWKLGWLDRKQGYQALNPYYPTLTPEKIATCHEQGLKVYPYTIDDPRAMALLVKWGVDGIITNDPAAALALQGR